MLYVTNVTKEYSNGKGVRNLSFSCPNGEVISIVGPNGSGKSTILNCIVGLLDMDNGSVKLNDYNTRKRESKKYIGYMSDTSSYNDNMSVYELLERTCIIKYNRLNKEEIEYMLKDFDLWNVRHMLIRKLSMGMKKKIGIILAFIEWPELIVLDEPTNGVDTKGIITLKNYILRARSKGCSIIVSSHILDFVSTISTQNIFMRNGMIAEMVDTSENCDLEYLYTYLYLS